MLRVGRERVLGYRVAAQGLDGGDGTAVLDLGVQDTPGGSGRLAFAARGLPLPGGLELAWTVRTAPHWHRAGDLLALTPALWPRSEAEGLTRLGWERKRLLRSGMPPQDAITTVAEAMRAVVHGPTTKGTVSAAVTARVPALLSHECRACRSTHVFETLLRLAALPAGIRLVPDAATTTLDPIPGWPPVPTEQVGTSALVLAYLRLLGPAAPVDVAAWLMTTRTELRAVWPDGLVEVDVDGRKAWIAELDADALSTAEPRRTVRLLPPSDPYLQARDRPLLVPDPAARKVLWPALGAPGAVLVDGEIVGAWRTRATGRKRLRIVVTPFGGIAPDDREALAEQARVVADVREVAEVNVEYQD